MPNIFLVFGYGIPKDILKDENYRIYLNTVFNKIYSISVKNPAAKLLIVFCGGATDMFKSHRRTEADEMIKFFSKLVKQRQFLRPITKNWVFISENKSISSLENLLYGKRIIEKRKVKDGNVFIFCEQTREKRIKIISKKIFDKDFYLRIVPVDFDITANRYLSPELIDKKEKHGIEYALSALQSVEKLKKHHEFFARRLKILREAGTKAHVETVGKFWESNTNDKYAKLF